MSNRKHKETFGLASNTSTQKIKDTDRSGLSGNTNKFESTPQKKSKKKDSKDTSIVEHYKLEMDMVMSEAKFMAAPNTTKNKSNPSSALMSFIPTNNPYVAQKPLSPFKKYIEKD